MTLSLVYGYLVSIMTKNKQKVIVGLSGGVDSALAAYLLCQQGYEVIGVFMQNWSQDVAGFCCNTDEEAMIARRVANFLGIKFYIWNFEEAYRQKVISYFFDEYSRGRTPNPDVMCNKEIKFKLFLQRALAMGADFVATGHYARINHDAAGYHLLINHDKNKDQSYFLATLQQEQLAHALFPIGEYDKPTVRRMAEAAGLPNFAKKDSQGICFIGKINVREFLQENIKPAPGKIIDPVGKVLGEHEGLAFYTIGQREGLPMLSNGPYYVVDKRMKTNELVVSKNPDDELLWRDECLITDLSWTNKTPTLPGEFAVVIRYHHAPASAHLEKVGDNTLKLKFNTKQRAITPGQLAVIYQGEELLGCGTIDQVF